MIKRPVWFVVWIDGRNSLTLGGPNNQEWFDTYEEAEAALLPDLREWEAQGFERRFIITQGVLHQSELGKWKEYRSGKQNSSE